MNRWIPIKINNKKWTERNTHQIMLLYFDSHGIFIDCTTEQMSHSRKKNNVDDLINEY